MPFWGDKVVGTAGRLSISEYALEALAKSNEHVPLPDITTIMTSEERVRRLEQYFRVRFEWPRNIQPLLANKNPESFYLRLLENATLSNDLRAMLEKGRVDTMWKGLVLLLILIGGGVYVVKQEKSSSKPKVEPPKPRLIALAVFAGRARNTGISPSDAVELFEDRFAWWAGEEAQWAVTKVRSGLEEKEFSSELRTEDDKLAVVVFRDATPDGGLVISPKDVRGAIRDAKERSSLELLGCYSVDGSKRLFDGGFQK